MASNKIMFLNKFEKFIAFRASCDCTDERDDIRIHIEVIDDHIEMVFYKKMFSVEYRPNPETFKDHVLNLKYRFINAIKLIFTGHIEVESDFLFCEEDQINSFVDTLIEGKEYIKGKHENNI